MINAEAHGYFNDEADFNVTIPLSATEFFRLAKTEESAEEVERWLLESPVPTPVLAGSGSTGLLFEHLRLRHPAGCHNYIRAVSTVVSKHWGL